MHPATPEEWQWFREAQYGLFVHWGPYAALGRGEQVLVREHLDQRAYERAACAWNPDAFDASRWAEAAIAGGFRYAVLTARHHDGYCLWNSRLTDYTSACQAPRRDFLAEYVRAFRAAGLRVGLYYSLGDFRVPAYWNDPAADPAGWEAFRDYVHGQVCELLTDYGPIDVFWFDGAWPHTAAEWRSVELLDTMRKLQPRILINNRLDSQPVFSPAGGAVEAAGESAILGDFGTPEHRIVADANRLWESGNTSTHRLWGFATGEHWRSTEQLLEMLVECAARGGNLLLNVGPDGNGRLPEPFLARSRAVGRWLALHREALTHLDPDDHGRPDITEFVTRGYQTRSGSNLYLILRFWDGRPALRLAALATPVRRATILATGQELAVHNSPEAVELEGLPVAPPCELFPVIKLECDGRPQAKAWDRPRLWSGDPRRFIDWAAARGRTPWVGR